MMTALPPPKSSPAAAFFVGHGAGELEGVPHGLLLRWIRQHPGTAESRPECRVVDDDDRRKAGRRIGAEKDLFKPPGEHPSEQSGTMRRG